MGSNREQVDVILDTLTTDENVDCLLVQVRPPQDDDEDRERMQTQIDSLKRLKSTTDKPIAVIAHSSTPAHDGSAIADLSKTLREESIPTFISYERTASVIQKVLEYNQNH